MRVRFQPMPLDEEIEGGQRKGKASLEGCPRAMQYFLEMTYPGQHRQDGLHHHPGIPEAAVTELEVRRIPFFGMEGGVTQDNHLAVERFNQRMEGGVWCIGPSTVPGHDQAPLIKHQTELAADNPAMVGFPFAPDLLSTAAFPHRVEQLNAVAVHYPQDRGSRQELVSPGMGGRKEPKEAGPFRQGGKQAAPVAPHPAIEGAIAHAFEGKEHAQGNDLAGPETGLGMFRDALHGFIYPVEQLADKVFGSHADRSLSWKGVATLSLGTPHGGFQELVKLAPLVSNWCRD
jgi:hypothetical protein